MTTAFLSTLWTTVFAPPDTELCIASGGHYYFPTTNVTIAMSGLPPAPVTWIYNTIDTVCGWSSQYNYYSCDRWREYFSFLTDKSHILSSWLSDEHKIPDIMGYKPTLLSFSQFYQQQQGTPIEEDHFWSRSVSYGAAWYQYAFRTDSTALGELTTSTAMWIILLCVLPLLRITKSQLLLPTFCQFGRRMALRTHGPVWVEQNQIRIQKFGEYIFRLLYHTSISIYGVYFFRNATWWSSSNSASTNHDATIEVFRGYPHHSISPSMAWYYILQSAYNVDALLTLLEMSFVIQFRSILAPPTKRTVASNTTTTRRSSSTLRFPLQFPVTIGWSPQVRGDFQEMFIHHIVTNALVIGSSMLRLTRIGSMVFLIHDISDVPVDLSKLANFLKWKITTIVCFGTMAITWFYTRLYILPTKIYFTSITKSHFVLEYGSVPVLLYVCYRHFFYIFLGLLIILHTVWFAMFVRMFITLVVKKEIHDYSEHRNGEPPTAANTHETKKKLYLKLAFIHRLLVGCIPRHLHRVSYAKDASSSSSSSSSSFVSVVSHTIMGYGRSFGRVPGAGMIIIDMAVMAYNRVLTILVRVLLVSQLH